MHGWARTTAIGPNSAPMPWVTSLCLSYCDGGYCQFCVRIVALLHVCLRGHSAVTLNFWLLQGKKLKGPDWYRSNITAINHEILHAFHSKDLAFIYGSDVVANSRHCKARIRRRYLRLELICSQRERRCSDAHKECSAKRRRELGQ